MAISSAHSAFADWVCMEISGIGLAVAAFFLVGGRLAVLYLGRLDAKTTGEPSARRRAIAASRCRAQGHLWLLGTLMSALFALVLAVGSSGTQGVVTVAIIAALSAAAAFCGWRTVLAYRRARRVGEGAVPGAEPRLPSGWR